MSQKERDEPLKVPFVLMKKRELKQGKSNPINEYYNIKEYKTSAEDIIDLKVNNNYLYGAFSKNLIKKFNIENPTNLKEINKYFQIHPQSIYVDG